MAGAETAEAPDDEDTGGRRSSPRYPVNAEVEILEPYDSHGVVINASKGGLRVAVDRELPLDVVCVVEILTDKGKTVEMARVAWSRAHPDGCLLGLSFIRE